VVLDSAFDNPLSRGLLSNSTADWAIIACSRTKSRFNGAINRDHTGLLWVGIQQSWCHRVILAPNGTKPNLQLL
jgi:hypothetical protein